MMFTSLLFVILFQNLGTSVQRAGQCLLKEGVGGAFGSIGITTRNNAGTPPKGVVLEYKDNVLDQIYVTTKQCRTSKGIGIGDSLAKVEELYGSGRKTTVEIKKGASSSIGKFGDFVTHYPGIAFVIYRKEVIAMFVVSEPMPGDK